MDLTLILVIVFGDGLVGLLSSVVGFGLVHDISTSACSPVFSWSPSEQQENSFVCPLRVEMGSLRRGGEKRAKEEEEEG